MLFINIFKIKYDKEFDLRIFIKYFVLSILKIAKVTSSYGV